MYTKEAEVRDDICDKLIEVARAQELISYDDLNKKLELGLDFLYKPKDRGLIGIWLDEISEYEVGEKRHMLSALVGRDRSGRISPNKGLHRCARRLGVFSGDDELWFWEKEVEKVSNYWISH